MKKIIFPIIGAVCTSGAMAADFDLSAMIAQTRAACSGISNAMHDLKVKAGINTAVTGVGTVAGGVALGTGIAKAKVDEEYDRLSEEILKLAAEKTEQGSLDITNPGALIAELEKDFSAYPELPVASRRLSELEKKSKTLGNVRTGTLAASTVTNVVGTAIAATNRVDGDLEEQIQNCIKSVKELANAKLAAKVEGKASDVELNQAEKIINGCRDYEMVDLKPINKRATGAAVASGIGIGTGVVGTITSAVANSNKVRSGDDQKEKNLNTTANVMAGASTVASATATIFNATQISAIKKVATVADACEEALK